MKKFKELVEHHLDTGYWTSKNDPRYGYLQSPKPFLLDQNLLCQLREVGQAVKAFHDGTYRMFDFANTNHDKNRVAAVIRQMSDQATGGLPLVGSNRPIPISKVDIMIDVNNQLQIAEIDSYNPRGIPFALYLQELFGNCSTFPGLTQTLIETMDGREDLQWLYAHKERYYEPIFLQMQRILLKEDITVHLANTNDRVRVDQNIMNSIIPWGMNQPNEVENKELLLSHYNSNSSNFMYPLVPWIGTKGLLGIISNSAENQSIEDVVRNHFTTDQIDLIRKYLPQCSILGRRFPESTSWCNGRKFVLKKNVSSGLKGVWFANTDHPEFKVATDLKRTSYIAQSCVSQKRFVLPYYLPTGKINHAEWYTRLIAYISATGEILDAEITGRQSPDVHGAPDCIMIPCIF